MHYHHRRQLLRCFARLRDQCEPIRPSRNVMRQRISDATVWRDFAATALGFTYVAPVVHVHVQYMYMYQYLVRSAYHYLQKHTYYVPDTV